ncbi:Fc.00g096210.m01.CDS01 [Cosmosporella sp. VM-42]
MADLGNFGASLISAKNENTAALVNINLDISLYRSDPSPEFLRVGSALAAWRKREAEDGELHKTACRLGFLFNELVPETPNLIRCYGARASDIMNSPNINPQGTAEDGPFRDVVGADGTCIWAAATSISASLSAFLLACMLARAWDAKKATSIWAELVHERITQVEAQINMNKVVSPHTVMAIRQDISRADLAKWDASARAWLRRADQSMVRRHDQFTLIMKNVKTPFVDPGSTFEKVTRAWIRSMKVLEDLLQNVPQQVPDRAVLMAISSWHLYPDLLVCQEKVTKVTLNDPLFPRAAILTLGLEPRKSQNDNLCQWSLALSHLKYYGEPIKVRSEEDLQRVCFPDLSDGGEQPDFFGVIHELQDDEDLEIGFKYVRQLASQLQLQAEDAIAVYSKKVEAGTYIEWATFSPVTSPAAGVETSEPKKTVPHCILDQRREYVQRLGEVCTVVHDEIWQQAIVFEQTGVGSMACSWNEAPRLFGGPNCPVIFRSLDLGPTVLGLKDIRLFIREIVLHGKNIRALVSHGLGPGLRWLNSKPDADAIVERFTFLQRVKSKSAKEHSSVDGPEQKRRPASNRLEIENLRYELGDLCYASPSFLNSLRALELATIIYRQLPTATVSLKVIDQELSKADWIPNCLKLIANAGIHEFRQAVSTPAEGDSIALPRCNVFAAIAMFESGILDIDVEHLDEVVALCSEDSIFVSGILLFDPETECLGTNIRHLVGNIGQAGMVLMVAPRTPKIRPPDYNPQLVRQHMYDGKCTNKFTDTTLHLSFTDWKLSLDWSNTGEIDQQVFLLESVISGKRRGNGLQILMSWGWRRLDRKSYSSSAIANATSLPQA